MRVADDVVWRCPDCREEAPPRLASHHRQRHLPPLTVRERLYGLPWPAWWVTRRGWLRIHRGLCPCCYSSPPKQDCPICRGCYDYGSTRITPAIRALWTARWKAWTGG